MATNIPVSFVKQFSSNIYHLSQQAGSRLRPYVQMKSLNAEAGFYDRLDQTEVYEKIGRNSDTEQVDMIYSRRRVSMTDYAWSTLVDKEDKLRLIHSPESEYTQSAMYAFGRKIDEIIISSALNPAWTGKDGNTPVALPTSQQIAAVDAGALDGLNIETLRQVRLQFWENESIMSNDEELIFACYSSDLMNMLRQTEVTNADYNTVRALAQGTVDDFMGFKFVRLELLPKVETGGVIAFDPATGEIGSGGSFLPAGTKRNFAMVNQSLIMGMGTDVMSRISERDDKHYANQVYASMSLGGTRMEEKKVMEVFTKG